MVSLPVYVWRLPLVQTVVLLIILTLCKADAVELTSLPSTEYNRLLDYVFKVNKYNPIARPVQSIQNITEVAHEFAIQQIINIDVKQEQMTVLFWQRMAWVDQTISWRPEDFGNISHFTIAPHHVWIPDIVVYNRVGNFDESKQSTIPLMVYSNGRIQWNKPMLLISTCNIHIRHFPYDRQRCDIKIGSWIHSANEITIKNHRGNMDENYFILNGEWHLLGTHAEENRMYYDNIPYTDVTYSVRLQRRPKFYEKNIVIPTALISLLATLVFLLPPESGEKIGLSITVFLALCVNLLLVAEMMPATSLETPIIGEYYLISISMVAMSLVATVMVLNVHNPHSNAMKPPRVIKFIFFECIARLVIMRRKPKTCKQDNKYPRHRDLYSPILMENNYDLTNGFKELYGKNCREVIGQRCPEQQQSQISPLRLSTCSNFSLDHVTKRGSQDCATVPQKEMNFNRFEKECEMLRNDRKIRMQQQQQFHQQQHQQHHPQRPHSNVERSSDHSSTNMLTCSLREQALHGAAGATQKMGCESTPPLTNEFVSIAKSIDTLISRMDLLVEKTFNATREESKSSDRDEILEEWHFLARVLDRFFAITSLLIIVIATILLVHEAKSQFVEVQTTPTHH